MNKEKNLVKIIIRKLSILALFFLFSSTSNAVSSVGSCRSYFNANLIITQITTYFDEQTGQIVHNKVSEKKTFETVPAQPTANTRGSFSTQTRSVSRGAPVTSSLTRSARGEFSPELESVALKQGLILTLAQNSDRNEILSFVSKVREEFGIRAEGGSSQAVLDGDLNNIQSSYENRNGHFLVFRQNGKVVGTAALFQLDSQTAEIRKMYLSSSLRGFGLGQLLMSHLLKKATEIGYATVELETYTVMKDAIALYERNGFVRFYPERIANEVGVVAYRRTIKASSPFIEESEIQRGYRLAFEDPRQNPFLESIYKNPERDGRFRYEVFEPYLKEEMRKQSSISKIYSELGLVFYGGRFVFPSLHRMIPLYIQALKNRNISEKDWILPSITYRREAAPGVYEYRTIVPYLEAFPTEPGFKLIEKVPDAIFEYALRNGAFPMANFHDIHHFVALLQSPSFLIKIKNALSQFRDTPFTLGQRRRFTYALESLSLIHTDQSSAAKAILGKHSLKSLNNLSGDKLLNLAETLNQHFDSLLSHYSAIGVSATETALELADYRSIMTAKELARTLRTTEVFDPLVEQNLPRNSFQEDPIYLTTKLDILIQAVQRGETSLEIESALRLLVAQAAVYILYSRSISVEKWIDDMLSPQFSHQNETMQFIKDAMGEDSITYRMLAVP